MTRWILASRQESNTDSAPERRLQNKLAIVTGGAGGIGRATALEFAAQGARVVVADIDKQGSEQTVKEIEQLGGESISVNVDVSSWESVEQLVNKAVASYGHLDIMFNNAGVSGESEADFLDLPLEAYRRVIGVNLHGVFHGIRAAGLAMRKGAGNHRGVIINTASFFGELAVPNFLPYITSKGAIIAMTKAAARDLAKYGIRVVAIGPGFIDTPITSHLKAFPEVWESVQKMNLREKAGTPKQVAKLVGFLASDDASFVNGSTVFVDDGASTFKR